MKKKISIEGMTCEQCKRHVEEALMELECVKSANADLKGKFAEIEVDREVDDGRIRFAVGEAGYEVTDIQ